MNTEGPPEKPRPEKLAEEMVKLFIENGIVDEEHCVQLAQNPALRERELIMQKENVAILMEDQNIDDVIPEELAEKIVDFLTLRGTNNNQS